MKEIQLTLGLVTMVDDEDFEWLNKWKWGAHKSGNVFYVSRACYQSGKAKTIKMHRLILGLNDSKTYCDHIDGNGLNNQRFNLRACTSSQNQMNRGAQKNNELGIKGIRLRKDNNKYQARIKLGGIDYYLGNFNTIEEAIIARKLADEVYHKEFASTIS